LHRYREDDLREIRKEMSGFPNWAGRTRGDKFSGFFTNIVIPDEIFTTTFSLPRTSEHPTHYHARRVKKYLYAGDRSKGKKKETLIEVIIAECNSIIKAHESIIDFMANSMASKIPCGEERGITIGDISFTGNSKRLLSIVFARNNIMAIVRSVGNLDLNVKSYAKKLDDFLVSKDKTVKSSNAPRISAFTLSTQQTTAEETVKISFNVIDPRGKDLMVKLFTTAGPISMQDNDLILECKKLGKHKVELYVINEDYLASNSKLDISVV
jgi:hypothetical protein